MRERNCGVQYPIYGQMPIMPMMPQQPYQQECKCSDNSINDRLNNLEKRVSNLEKFTNPNNYSNYQMM